MRRLSLTLASCLIIAFASVAPSRAAGAPRGVHIAFGADPTTTATIAWFTDGTTDPGSIVEYGTDDRLGQRVSGSAMPAPRVDALVHEATLSHLPPGKPVFYRAGSDEGGWTPVRSFRTAPVAPASFHFDVMSDHGTSVRSRITTADVIDDDPDFVVMAGDLSYANNQTAIWDQWFNEIEPLASTRAVMVAPGNHDTDIGENGDGSASYRARFALPGRELFYSYDYGRVHFLVMHTTTLAAVRESVLADEIAFAEQDLNAAAARRDAGALDFLVVVQHHPLFGSMANAGAAADYMERRQNTAWITMEEQMLHRYNVDLLIAGHNHHYERSYPMLYGRPTTTEPVAYKDPTGLMQMISGGAGSSTYAFVDPNDVGPWSAVRAKSYHYVSVTVTGKTMRFVARDTIDEPGRVLDDWTLTTS